MKMGSDGFLQSANRIGEEQDSARKSATEESIALQFKCSVYISASHEDKRGSLTSALLIIPTMLRELISNKS